MRKLAPALMVAAALGLPTAHADEGEPPPWCAPELETLPGEVCFASAPDAAGPDAAGPDAAGPDEAGPEAGERRTLVIFLHGLVSVGVDWQHAQQRAAVRGGVRNHFAVLAPKAVPGARRDPDTVAWPTNRAAQEQHEKAVLARIAKARALVEERDGPFDEVFVVGFSNGAYYASSLALRGAYEADGFAVFAGGTSYGAASRERAPVFVGVCSRDRTSKDDSEKLAKHLQRLGWPHRTERRKVGHLMSDAHLDRAITYLRSTRDDAATKADAAKKTGDDAP